MPEPDPDKTLPLPKSGSISGSDEGSESLVDSVLTDTGIGHLLKAGQTPTTNRQWQPPSVEELQNQLPQYEIIEYIARGGMGAVYKGIQKTLKRLVAIKVLPYEADDTDLQFAARFKHEAQAMAKLTHPNIINVYDAGETSSGLLYFIMEYVDGQDVSQLITSKGLVDSDEAVKIITAVCDALSFAHEEGILHRDIKPSNVMIDKRGRVKVADFGLAKMLNMESTLLTGSHVAMGTPDFIAPEALVEVTQLDHRADLYAVGVMLYQMLTGRIPRGRFALPSGVNAKIDPRLDAVVDKALQTDPNNRYSSALEIKAEILNIHSGAPLITTTPSGNRKVSRLFIALTAVTLLLALAAGSLFYLRDKNGIPTTADTGTATTSPSPALVFNNGDWQNLIPFIDVKSPVNKGTWEIMDGRLELLQAEDWGFCEIPIKEIPENYDLRLSVIRRPGSNLALYIPFKTREGSTTLVFDYYNDKEPSFKDQLRAAGLEGYKGGNIISSAGSLFGKRKSWLPENQQRHIEIQVRKNSLRIRLDGHVIHEWQGDWNDYRQNTGRVLEAFSKANGRPAFGVGGFKSAWTFQSIEMRKTENENLRTGHFGPQAHDLAPADALRAQPGNFPHARWIKPWANIKDIPFAKDMGNDWFTIPNETKLRRIPGAEGANWGVRGTFKRGAASAHMPQLMLRANSITSYNVSVSTVQRMLMFRRMDSNLPGYNLTMQQFPIKLPDPGQEFKMEFTAIGNKLYAYFNGQKFEYEPSGDNIIASGGIGLYDINDHQITNLEVINLDDFTAEEAYTLWAAIPSHIKLWDTPASIPEQKGFAWENEGVRLQADGEKRNALRYESLKLRDFIFRFSVRLQEGSTEDFRIRRQVWRTEGEKSESLSVSFSNDLTKILISKVGEDYLSTTLIKELYITEELKTGDWAHVEIDAVCDLINIRINGKFIGAVRDGSILNPGYLGLSTKSTAYYKNIMIIPLDVDPEKMDGIFAPTQRVQFKDHLYQFVKDNVSYADAVEKAKAMGGHLATLTSKEESDWVIKTYLTRVNTAVWLGAKRHANDGWAWITGEPWSYTDWAKSSDGMLEPKHPLSEEVALHVCLTPSIIPPGGWADHSINGHPDGPQDQNGFLVEWDSAQE